MATRFCLGVEGVFANDIGSDQERYRNSRIAFATLFCICVQCPIQRGWVRLKPLQRIGRRRWVHDDVGTIAARPLFFCISIYIAQLLVQGCARLFPLCSEKINLCPELWDCVVMALEPRVAVGTLCIRRCTVFFSRSKISSSVFGNTLSPSTLSISGPQMIAHHLPYFSVIAETLSRSYASQCEQFPLSPWFPGFPFAFVCGSEVRQCRLWRPVFSVNQGCC